jgi:hypothetical protein
MDGGYNIYGPKGFHTLMKRSPSANEYFSSLPEEVQAKMLRKAGAISTEDDLRALAQHYMKAR